MSITSAALVYLGIMRCAERYPKKEMSTPAATAEPITPLMLLDMQ